MKNAMTTTCYSWMLVNTSLFVVVASFILVLILQLRV